MGTPQGKMKKIIVTDRDIHPMKYRSDLDPQADACVHFAQLDAIMGREELCNIALTGNRGSGKSSIIHSYDRYINKGKERFLYISLAEFEHYLEEAQRKIEEEAKKEQSSKGTADGEDAETVTTENEVVQEKANDPPTGTDAKKDEQQGKSFGDNQNEDAPKLIPMPKRKKLEAQEQNEIQKKLEYSMLSQILAKCARKDLRNSSLQSIPEIKEARHWFWVKLGYVFCLFMLVCGLLFEERFGLLVRLEGWPDIERVRFHALGYATAFAMVFTLGAYIFNRKPGLFQFGKLAVKTPLVEAEISPSQNIFCLDHYRFELIHILNQLAKDISYTVVIEDLEFVHECCAEQIMSKLRELNLLVNTHREAQFKKKMTRNLRWHIFRNLKDEEENEQRLEDEHALKYWILFWGLRLRRKYVLKPVRFVYAISDETFDEDQRTKFFDTIVPVTPALNPSNGFEIIKNMLTGRIGMAESKTLVMAYEISKVVIDYRQMNDISTEYKFFSKWFWENNPLNFQNTNSTAGRNKKAGEAPKTKPGADESMDGKLVAVRGDEPARKGSGDEGGLKTLVMSELKDDVVKDITKKEQRDYERELLAIAVYKALLPREYHYAFTRKRNGVLMNPRYERFHGIEYDKKVVALIDFLFRMGYLNESSLALVGYSLKILQQQWIDILTNGTYEDQRDLLGRFNPKKNGSYFTDQDGTQVDGEQEHAHGENTVKAQMKQNAENQDARGGSANCPDDLEVVKASVGYIFLSVEDALVTYYAKLFDEGLTANGLANLLVSLGCFEEIGLKAAIKNVNEIKGDPEGTERIKKEFQVQLINKLEDAQKVYSKNQNLKKKFVYAFPAIALLLGAENKADQENLKKKYSLN